MAFGHEDEVLRHRFPEGETWGGRLGVKPDHQIDERDIVGIEGADLVDPDRARGQIIEVTCRLHVEQAAKLVIARNAALAAAHGIGRGEIDTGSFR